VQNLDKLVTAVNIKLPDIETTLLEASERHKEQIRGNTYVVATTRHKVQ